MTIHDLLEYHTPSMRHAARAGVALIALWLIALYMPAVASAHGAADPEASDELATISHLPAGVQGHVVDGDLRLWLSVAPSQTLIVLDYQGGPYLRFDRRGVQVNENSPMYYLNLTPPIAPSIRLAPSMRPRWLSVSSGHSDRWHDGRLAALAETLHAPGARILGRWTIPVLLDGRRTAITGMLHYTPRPSFAWLWPPVVALLILPALLRLGDRSLERRVCRPIAAVTVLAAGVLAFGAGLHGRPGTAGSLVAVMVVELAALAWAAALLIRGRDGPLSLGLIAIFAGYRALVGLPVLWRGYVLLAVPATLGRGAVSLCLAGSIILAAVAVRATDAQRRPGASPARSG